MKKSVFVVAVLMMITGIFADTVTVREPGLVEGLVVGSGGIVKGLVGIAKELLVGRTVTYTNATGKVAVPSCAVVTTPQVMATQPAVIPATPPVVVTPAVQTVTVTYPVAVVTEPVVYVQYRGWGPPPLRPRRYRPCRYWRDNYPRPPLRY